MKKRITSLVVCAALLLGLVPAIGHHEAHAATTTTTEGLVVDKTVSTSPDANGNYTVTVEAYVSGTANKKPAGAMYYEEIEAMTEEEKKAATFYIYNAYSEVREIQYCETCKGWYAPGVSYDYLKPGTLSTQWAMYYELTTKENAFDTCAENHCFTFQATGSGLGAWFGNATYATINGQFIPVGEKIYTSESSDLGTSPLVCWFFTSQEALGAAYYVETETKAVEYTSDLYGGTQTYEMPWYGTRYLYPVTPSAVCDLEGVDSSYVLSDTVSEYFEIVGTPSVSIVDHDGEITGSLSATVSGSTIRVSGFDYSANYWLVSADYPNLNRGKKVVLTYKIKADGITGMGGVYNIGTDAAGVYSGSTMKASLPNPTLYFAREDESNVSLLEQDGLELTKTVTDNQDNTYTVTLSAYVTGKVVNVDGAVFADELDISQTYYIYDTRYPADPVQMVTWCDRCQEWWEDATWHIYHYFTNKDTYQYTPRTGLDDNVSVTGHTQFFTNYDAALASKGNYSYIKADLELDNTAEIRDYVSSYFTLVADSVKAYTSYYNGSTFIALSAASVDVEQDANTGVISVSGFDFASNCVAEGTSGGRRLVVSFTVTPKDGVTGVVPTNGVDSGVYKADATAPVAHFPRPTVNVVKYDTTSSGGDTEETPELDLSGLNLDKLLTVDENGNYTINLEAYTEGAVTTSTGTPLDVVFVMHRSSSTVDEEKTMSGKWVGRWLKWWVTESETTVDPYILNVEKAAIEEMIRTLQNDNATDSNGVGHRVSLVAFAGDNEGVVSQNDSTLVKGTYVVSDLMEADATDLLTGEGTGLLWDVTATTGNYYYEETLLGTATTPTYLNRGDGTRVDLALETASGVFDATSESSERQKVVIVLMTGIPGNGWGNTTWGGGDAVTVADAALVYAQELKNSGAQIYTIGLYPNSVSQTVYVTDENGNYVQNEDGTYRTTTVEVDMNDGAPSNTWHNVAEDTEFNGFNAASPYDYINNNRFLHFISSNHTTGITSVLEDLTTLKSAVYDWHDDDLDGDGDGDGYFITGKTVDEAQVAIEIINNTIAPVVQLGSEVILKDEVTKYFDIDQSSIKVSSVSYDGTSSTDITSQVAVTVSGNTISVTGYNYFANNVDSTAGTGNKLVVSFNITPKDGFVGGNNVPTNVASTSGLYLTADDGLPSANFGASPEANVPITAPTFVTQDAVINYGDSVSDLKLYYEIDTLTDGWKYDYVNDITYSHGTVSNQACGTYTVTATISPKYNGGASPVSNGVTAVGTAATATSGTANATVHVRTPYIAVWDKVIYLGQSVNVSELAEVSGWSCPHGEKSNDDASAVTLSVDGVSGTISPNDCTTYTVQASINGTVLSKSTSTVHVLTHYITETLDSTVYLSQSVDLSKLVKVGWKCVSASVANHETVSSAKDDLDTLIGAAAPTFTYDFADTAAITEVDAYAPTECTEVTVSVTDSRAGKKVTSSAADPIKVHILEPVLTVTDTTIYLTNSVNLNAESVTSLSWLCDDGATPVGMYEGASVIIPAPTQAAPTTDLVFTQKGDGEVISDEANYAPTDCQTLDIDLLINNVDVDEIYNDETIEVEKQLNIHVSKPVVSFKVQDLYADYGDEITFFANDASKVDAFAEYATVTWTTGCDHAEFVENTEGAESSGEATDTKPVVKVSGTQPTVEVAGYVIKQDGSEDAVTSYTMGEEDVKFSVNAVTVKITNENNAVSTKALESGSFAADSVTEFTIHINKFDLVIDKTYAGTYDDCYAQNVVFQLTDEKAAKSIRIVGEDDGSTTVKGLICGKTYTVTEETEWSWRYELTNSETKEQEVTCTNGISNEDPATEQLTKSVTFDSTLTILQWLSKMIKEIFN